MKIVVLKIYIYKIYINNAVYTVLFLVFFTIKVGGIGAYFVYFHGYLKRMFTCETTIY